MSQANLDVFEKGNDAFRRGDWDAMAATMDGHILVRADSRWPEQRFYGREAVIAFWRGLWESWGPDARVEEVIDLGDDFSFVGASSFAGSTAVSRESSASRPSRPTAKVRSSWSSTSLSTSRPSKLSDWRASRCRRRVHDDQLVVTRDG